MEAPDLLRAWPIPEPSAIRPVATGTNNRTWSVTAASETFVLRLTQNTGDPVRVRYEHVLLARLDRAGLSFAVPAPLPTRVAYRSSAAASLSRELLQPSVASCVHRSSCIASEVSLILVPSGTGSNVTAQETS
jgi:Phosphotransferase enzyme family